MAIQFLMGRSLGLEVGRPLWMQEPPVSSTQSCLNWGEPPPVRTQLIKSMLLFIRCTHGLLFPHSASLRKLALLLLLLLHFIFTTVLQISQGLQLSY